MHPKFGRTKHTILIVAGVAALAAGTAVPTAGAKPENGASVDAATCAEWEHWVDQDIDYALQALFDQGSSDLFDKYIVDAKHTLQDAKDANCPWAQGFRLPPGLDTREHGTLSGSASTMPVDGAPDDTGSASSIDPNP